MVQPPAAELPCVDVPLKLQHLSDKAALDSRDQQDMIVRAQAGGKQKVPAGHCDPDMPKASPLDSGVQEAAPTVPKERGAGDSTQGPRWSTITSSMAPR